MRLSCFLSRFVQRLSIRPRRGCVRPCGLDGALIGRFVRLSGTGVSHKVSPGHPFLLHQLLHPHNVWLTLRFKTLYSP